MRLMESTSHLASGNSWGAREEHLAEAKSLKYPGSVKWGFQVQNFGKIWDDDSVLPLNVLLEGPAIFISSRIVGKR